MIFHFQITQSNEVIFNLQKVKNRKLFTWKKLWRSSKKLLPKYG